MAKLVKSGFRRYFTDDLRKAKMYLWNRLRIYCGMFPKIISTIATILRVYTKLINGIKMN